MNKRLYRSREDVWLGGVAGGIGEYFEIDPVIIRLVWLLTFFLGGTGLFAYLIAWIIIPENPVAPMDSRSEGPAKWSETVIEAARGTGSPRQALGWILVIVGIVLLLLKVMPWFLLVLGAFWPIALVILGIVLLVQGMRR